jgi:hypothetical protein
MAEKDDYSYDYEDFEPYPQSYEGDEQTGEDFDTTTDDSQLSDVADGKQNLDVVQPTNPPTDPQLNDKWIDSSVTPWVTWIWDGTIWNKATPTSAGEVGAAKTFIVQPTPPYLVGDVWLQGGSGDIYNCVTARASGAYVALDWAKASKYTDDTTANTALGKANTSVQLSTGYNGTIVSGTNGLQVISTGFTSTFNATAGILITRNSDSKILFKVDPSSGNVTFSGALSGASGDFNGSLTADTMVIQPASGTFPSFRFIETGKQYFADFTLHGLDGSFSLVGRDLLNNLAEVNLSSFDIKANVTEMFGKIITHDNITTFGEGALLTLKASTHAFMEFYNDGGTTRAGWLGYGSSAASPLQLRNESGDINISPKTVTNKINLVGDCYISNGVGLTIGTANSANTANQLLIYNTGDAIILQSGNNLDAYNPGNLVWKTSGGIMVGRMHVNGTSYASTTMVFEVTDETGVLNPNPMLELNAAGANWAKFDAEVDPAGDNTRQLGNATLRWKQLVAGTATISTSDELLKQQISDIPDAWLDAWSEVNFIRYKFNDAVAEKGADNARWHVGVIAQRIEEAFIRHGADAFDVGILCYDSWVDANGITQGRYSIRADECQFLEMALTRRELNKLKGIA